MNSVSEGFSLQQPVNKISLIFVLVTLFALAVTKFADANLTLQNELLGQVYNLKNASNLSLAHLGAALKGNSEALKQLQNANQDGIQSLNILQNGSLKKNMDPAPIAIQEALIPYAESWNKIAKLSAQVLQTRSQLQGHSDKIKVIKDSLNKLVAMQKPVIEALLLNSTNLKQSLLATQQQQLLYELKSAWFETQYDDLATQQSAYKSLKVTSKNFSENQKILLNGSATENLTAVQDPQIRRLIANVSTQLAATQKQMNESIAAGKTMQNLSTEHKQLLAQQHIHDQQASHLVLTTQSLNTTFWVQHWQIYLLLLVLTGLYFFLVYNLKPSTDAPLISQEEDKTPDPTTSTPDITTTHANRLKAAQNQLINEVRQLGEGKLHFDVTDTNESTREIAQAYNQSKKRFVLLLRNIQKQNSQINQSLTTQKKQAESEISKQIGLIGNLRDQLPSLISSYNPRAESADDIKSTLELSNKIRARLSLANEKLNKLAKVEPSKFTVKEFSALQNHIEKLLGSLDEAEIEQEQLTVYLKDMLKEKDTNQSIETSLKPLINDLNPQLTEISVNLNQLEDILKEVFKLHDSTTNLFSLIELDQGAKKAERSGMALV